VSRQCDEGEPSGHAGTSSHSATADAPILPRSKPEGKAKPKRANPCLNLLSKTCDDLATESETARTTVPDDGMGIEHENAKSEAAAVGKSPKPDLLRVEQKLQGDANIDISAEEAQGWAQLCDRENVYVQLTAFLWSRTMRS